MSDAEALRYKKGSSGIIGVSVHFNSVIADSRGHWRMVADLGLQISAPDGPSWPTGPGDHGWHRWHGFHRCSSTPEVPARNEPKFFV